jgi:long-subunit acyl-CoA synthetase (AMP-forming)
MSTLTLFTSGSTDEPKEVKHSWDYIKECATKSIKEIGLTKDDIVLDVFPANTIAHYTITALPAFLSGAQHVSSNFSTYTYPELFNRVKPTVIALIPRHLELLSNTKAFKQLDMSSVRYMVTGSSKIEQSFIDAFRERGVQTVANWYGMTEFPPPVMIGYNSTSFDLNTIKDDHVMFYPISSSSLHECYINGKATGDLFEMNPVRFVKRAKETNGQTWKTKV